MLNRIWDPENKYPGGVLKEYAHWVLEVSYKQHTLGCYIIFAKRGVERISQLNTKEFVELGQVMFEIEQTLERLSEFRPDRFNYLQLGNFLTHLHFHGIPRYASKRTFAGREWRDTTFGRPPAWAKEEVSCALVEMLRETIKPHLA